MGKKSGFTIIEILVSLSILSIGSLMMGQLLTQGYQGGRTYDIRRVVAELGDRSAKTIRSSASQRLTRALADNDPVFDTVEAAASIDPSVINNATGDARHFIALVEDSGLLGTGGSNLISRYTAGSTSGFTRASQTCDTFPSVHCPIRAKAFLQLDCETSNLCRYQPLQVWVEIESVPIGNNQVIGPAVISRTVRGYFNSLNNILIDSKITDDFGSSSSGMSNCAIFGNGGMKCWGLGANGQIGVGSILSYGDDPTRLNSAIPWVMGVGTNWTQVSIGGAPNTNASRSSGFACGIQTAGGVYCWGLNVDGQLGTTATLPPASAIQETTPKLIYSGAGAERAIQIVTGTNHACLLKASGEAVCWGRNSQTLSDGGGGSSYLSFADRPFIWGNDPVWGNPTNNQGKLGTGNALDQFTPTGTAVQGQAFERLAAGAVHTCGIVKDLKKVICWGSGGILASTFAGPGTPGGSLGSNDELLYEDDWNTNPVNDDGPNPKHDGTKSVTMDHSVVPDLFATAAKSAANAYGDPDPQPTVYTADNGGKLSGQNMTVSAFVRHDLIGALAPNGIHEVVTYKGGVNTAGNPDVLAPNSINYMLYFRRDGLVPEHPGDPIYYGWAAKAEMADSSVMRIATNIVPKGAVDPMGKELWYWDHLALRLEYVNPITTLELYVDGARVGTTSSASTPIVDNTKDFSVGIPLTQVGSYSSFEGYIDHVQVWQRALSADEIVLASYGHCAWSGMLGSKLTAMGYSGPINTCYTLQSTSMPHRDRIRLDATLQTGEEFVDINSGADVTDLSVGDFHSCAVSGGKVFCWGSNYAGQLGLGDRRPRFGPVEVSLGAGFSAKQVAAGGCSLEGAILPHTCALSTAGEVKCWGGNLKGQLGLGSTAAFGDDAGETPNTLGAVNLGTQVTAKRVTVGCGHTCVLTNKDRFKCWGYNAHGQLGIGTITNMGDGGGEMGDDLPFARIFDDAGP